MVSFKCECNYSMLLFLEEYEGAELSEIVID